MSDLIRREDAIEVADAVWTVTGDKNVAKVWDQIKNLPSAQPVAKDINVPVSDCISRQAAIDIARDVCDAILSQCGSHYDGDDEVYDDLHEVDAVLKCNKEIRIALANMPSVQGWIPVAERLPDNRGWYLISDDTETWVAYYSLFDNEWCGINSIPLNVVIAWQPLPEPYKENQ